ncbi:hypothetical protein M422DRAFT_262639 [Sphaerobolus stellatus SS14]|uniref:Unplaced genomic scaffold SPHSTscaffold_117, whole genome shotgun sequence n=1 Tax=Sphaerobolus stellatus (strain SS14) TaxID=990650 RepID=A0A0C9VCK9_SPHS4|nr:hypothetical protein M422DRAFT_262639 [Sphaerobolus stellatus SS14]
MFGRDSRAGVDDMTGDTTIEAEILSHSVFTSGKRVAIVANSRYAIQNELRCFEQI